MPHQRRTQPRPRTLPLLGGEHSAGRRGLEGLPLRLGEARLTELGGRAEGGRAGEAAIRDGGRAAAVAVLG